MCGIAFCLSLCSEGSEEAHLPQEWAGLVAANASRGTDSHLTHTHSIPSSSQQTLTFFSSVLHLRGPSTFVQPVVDQDSGDVFCWNGQVFGGLDLAGGSDTLAVWEKLKLTGGKEEEVKKVFGEVEGPWAMIYFHAATRTLFVSRDPLGRRSLLVSRPTPTRPRLIFASVATKETQGWDWKEIGCEGMLKIELDQFTLDGSSLIEILSRSPEPTSSRLPFTSISPVNITLPSPSFSPPLPNPTAFPDDDPILASAADEMINALSESVRRRVDNIPPASEPSSARLAILFSGGIDCTVIALLSDRFIPPSEPIDLLNVGFENPRSLQNILQLQRQQASSKAKGKARGPPEGKVASPAVEEETDEEKRQRVYGVPDRLTGLEGVEELRRLRPDRIWNFVEVDVPYEECARLTPHVLSLMFPNETIMDLSLALALFFASRGIGSLPSPTDPLARIPYTSRAKVLLSGLGADEQLGGYARHRRAYETAGWEGVVQEIQLDLTRIPTRNLGRDDRIISSHSKESRYPFLSLSFIDHLSSFPIDQKMDFRYTEPREGGVAIGDKLLLRIAAGRLGLTETRGRKKRAMQFDAHRSSQTRLARLRSMTTPSTPSPPSSSHPSLKPQHYLFVARTSYGHTRPTLNLALNLLTLHSHLFITFVAYVGNFAKIEAEMARHELTDEAKARFFLLCLGKGGNDEKLAWGDIMTVERSIAADFAPAYGKLLMGVPLDPAHQPYSLPPQVVIANLLILPWVLPVKAGVEAKLGWTTKNKLLGFCAIPGSSALNLFNADWEKIFKMLDSGATDMDVVRDYTAAQTQLEQTPGVPPYFGYEHQTQPHMRTVPDGMIAGMKIISAAFRTSLDGFILPWTLEMEPDVKDALESLMSHQDGKKGEYYAVGPQFNPSFWDQLEDPARGRSVAVEFGGEDKGREVMEFLDRALDERGPGSVLLISFGTIVVPSETSQLLALFETLNSLPSTTALRYVLAWATTDLPNEVQAIVEQSPEGRGIVADWVPQQSVLSHDALGWCLTHGGSNTVNECIVNTVPIIAFELSSSSLLSPRNSNSPLPPSAPPSRLPPSRATCNRSALRRLRPLPDLRSRLRAPSGQNWNQHRTTSRSRRNRRRDGRGDSRGASNRLRSRTGRDGKKDERENEGAEGSR